MVSILLREIGMVTSVLRIVSILGVANRLELVQSSAHAI